MHAVQPLTEDSIVVAAYDSSDDSIMVAMLDHSTLQETYDLKIEHDYANKAAIRVAVELDAPNSIGQLAICSHTLVTSTALNFDFADPLNPGGTITSLSDSTWG